MLATGKPDLDELTGVCSKRVEIISTLLLSPKKAEIIINILPFLFGVDTKF